MHNQSKYDILKKYFGYDSFREGQELMIDSILSGRDVLGIMPTGAGKSLCYQVPALLLPGITVVISPLISLMNDQVRALNDAGIHAAYINSTLTDAQISKALGFAAQGRYKIVYVAPERLGTYEFMRFSNAVDISMVTVDEAHCISQWGQDFRPSYLKILEFVKSLKKRPVISAFTATATTEVREDILRVMQLQNPKILVTGFDRKNLFFSVERVRNKDRYIMDYLEKHRDESGIIYCATRKNVDKLYEGLQAAGFSVAEYHAGLSNETRRLSQDDFIYDRKSIIIATNAFGMGIDKSNVRYVIHYNMPQNLENYYQEAGRAGRDGEPAECVLLYSPQDIVINRFLLESKDEIAEMTAEERKILQQRDESRLRTMTTYCTTTECLRAYILHYFGEQDTMECGNCSNCLCEYDEIDITDTAYQIIDCVKGLRQRFGMNVIVGTLRGRDNAKLREYGVQNSTAYGKLHEMGDEQIKQVIQYLLQEEYLRLTMDKYALVKITSQGYDFLENYNRYQSTSEIEMVRIRMKTPKAEHVEEAMTHKAKASKARNARSASEALTSRGLELFEALRKLRMQIAKEEGMPPYIVFNDKTLTDMCIKMPLDREAMLEVNGVGENKYKKYGERFLEEIRKFVTVQS